jgi:16S rRNA (uracil1498-N3)-methyltransferase
LQQARDTRLPLVSIHKRFKVLVEDDLDGLAHPGTRLVAHPGATTTIEAAPALAGTRDAALAADDRVLLAVGPEGGWTEFELTLLQRHGFRAVGLGPRPLRSDTACVALLTLVHAALRRQEDVR